MRAAPPTRPPGRPRLVVSQGGSPSADTESTFDAVLAHNTLANLQTVRLAGIDGTVTIIGACQAAGPWPSAFRGSRPPKSPRRQGFRDGVLGGSHAGAWLRDAASESRRADQANTPIMHEKSGERFGRRVSRDGRDSQGAGRRVSRVFEDVRCGRAARQSRLTMCHFCRAINEWHKGVKRGWHQHIASDLRFRGTHPAGLALSSLPSWLCRFDPGHPLHPTPRRQSRRRPPGP